MYFKPKSMKRKVLILGALAAIRIITDFPEICVSLMSFGCALRSQKTGYVKKRTQSSRKMILLLIVLIVFSRLLPRNTN